MADYLVTDQELTSIADAFITAIGKSEQLSFPTDYINGVEELVRHCIGFKLCPALNKYSAIRSYMSSLTYDCGYISEYGAANISEIQTLSFSKCTGINDYAFYRCSNLTSAYFPMCNIIRDSAFAFCGSLSDLTLSSTISYIGSSAFYNCVNLTSFNFSGGTNLTTIYNGAFCGCENLSSIGRMVSCKTIKNHAFANCTALPALIESMFSTGSIEFGTEAFANAGISFVRYSCNNGSGVITLSSGVFKDCKSLQYVSLGSFAETPSYVAIRSLGGYCFMSCSNLSHVKLMGCGSDIFAGGAVFTSCYRLLSLYLVFSSKFSLSSYVVNPFSGSNFNSTPIGGYTNYTNGVLGSIYIYPSVVVDRIKDLEGWSSISDRLVGLTSFSWDQFYT